MLRRMVFVCPFSSAYSSCPAIIFPVRLFEYQISLFTTHACLGKNSSRKKFRRRIFRVPFPFRMFVCSQMINPCVEIKVSMSILCNSFQSISIRFYLLPVRSNFTTDLYSLNLYRTRIIYIFFLL